MTRNETKQVKKAITLCYTYGHDYAGSYLENAIKYYDITIKSDHKKSGDMTQEELTLLSDVINICDKYNLYGTGDLLFEIISAQVNGGDL